jgi:hypothetical protein
LSAAIIFASASTFCAASRAYASFALALIVVAAPTSAQELGRPQDGFYSGQTGGPSNGQASERVDGRANRKEGVPPDAGDEAKRIQGLQDRSPPLNAEAMDPIVRPGALR